MTRALRTRSGPSGVARGIGHPGRVIAGAFAAAVAVGTALLSLPAAKAGEGGADLLTALFHATSAVCVTGLVTVDTASYWSGFGQAVILLLIQAGGLGIMTLATLLALLLSRRLGLRARLIAQAETKTLGAADVRRVVGRVVVFSLVSEAVVAVVLSVRFAVGYDHSLPSATYFGVFHAVSAFNNAGFGLNSDNLVQYVGDPWISLTVCAAVILGGLGFPVVFELAREWRTPKTWSVLTRITVVVTVALLVVGTAGMLVAEGRNPETLGRLGVGDRVLAAFTAAVMPRTAGFNNLDIAAYRPETLLLTDALMFIGGGSAGTAGGIKVTTFGLLAYVLWAEMRGDPDVDVGRRRVPATNQRQALAVALLGIGIVAVATFLLEALTDFGFDQVLFEVVSAFATVGLSTGITADLPPAGQVLLVLLMYVGRIGPLTLASGLALRERARRHRLPEERTIVG
ncbi:TrkH family potassium uptake protein [Geodermatophilus sp. YIM 151500]|uniref:TrkH family potassium uptake protein n=1 Tax=Geodermatophilus sp. YIM 151500 TaxID=2984531 RepID=UPI0021E3FFD6|nr:potassium transporter TrkG [Geodermatophilus sp. YIM 151500]MCV2490861.1 TrkH family potassium uptake protein [Geodermatophilus sp. YIM 151500]